MPINYRDYPADWKLRRARILDRAGHACERCGLPNYSIIRRSQAGAELLRTCKNYQWARLWRVALQGRIVVLTVAHLDHDEWNHDVHDSRLAAFCQACHLRHDRYDNDQRKKYGKRYKENQLSIIP